MWPDNNLAGIDSLFEGLLGSGSLTQLSITTRLSEQVVQTMLPLLINAPKASTESGKRILTADRPHVEWEEQKLSLMDGDIGDVYAFG